MILIQKGSAADQAGVKRGDVVVASEQDGKRHEILTPVDLAGVENDWGPRGKVRLIAKREGKLVNFDLLTVPWGFHSSLNRADLSLLDEKVWNLAKSRQVPDIEEYCRSACAGLTAYSRPWGDLEVARLIALSEQRKEADEFFALALYATPSQMLAQRALIEYAWADACRQRADWAAAKQHYSASLAAHQGLSPYSLAIGLDLYNLALVEFRLGDLTAAEKLATQALHLRRKLSPRSLDVVKTLNYLGVFSLQDGDLETADEYLRESLTLAQQLNPNGREMTFALNNLGATAEKEGELALAEQYYARDFEISRRRNPDDYLLSYSLGNLGTIAFERGNLQRAKAYYSQAVQIQEKGRTNKDLAVTLNNLADVSAEEGDTARAEQLLRQALGIQETAVPNSVELAQTLDTLGTVLRQSGHLQEATEVLQRALVLRQALSPGSLGVAETMQHLGEVCLDQKDEVQAQDRFSAAAQIRQTLAPDSAAYADSLAALAKVARARNQLDLADTDLAKALNVLDNQEARLGGERESRLQFGARYSSYYSDYISLLMTEGKPERAVEILERSRARILEQKLESQGIHITNGIAHSLLRRQHRIQEMIEKALDDRITAASNNEPAAKVTALGRRLEDLKAERERILSEITVATPRYAYVSPSRPLSLIEIQRLLGPGTLLLEYSLDRVGSYAFAITDSRLESFSLPGTDVISRLVEQYYAQISASPYLRTRSADEAGSALSKVIVGPLAATLGQYGRILIVGDGVLNYVPFASLPPPHPTPEEPYLVSRHEIGEVPSASFLAMVRRARQSHLGTQFNRVAVIADPVFEADDPRVSHVAEVEGASGVKDPSSGAAVQADLPASEIEERQAIGTHLSRLLYSRAEADAIASAVGKERTFLALNFNANRRVATSPEVLRSRIVHYATHGAFSTIDPDFSGLVFSTVDESGHPRPGLWSIDEVFNSSITADMVVLSACDTALGQQWDGEGTVGLTRAFMYAGAKSVVASLWRVDDAGTAELMRLFYIAMEHKGMQPESALRWAQLEITKQDRWRDPYFWAGFTLQGDGHGKYNPMKH